MKRFGLFILTAVIVFFNVLPAAAISEAIEKPEPVKPYERVIAKNGNWYTEQFPKGESESELIIAYEGDYKTEEAYLSEKLSAIKFSVSEKTVLTGIWLPYSNAVNNPVQIKLTDKKGNVFGPYKAQETLANTIAERYISKEKNEAENDFKGVNYVFMPETEVVLPKGEYAMTVSNPEWLVRTKDTGSEGAWLIKGILYSANKKYKEDMLKWEMENEPGKILSDAGLENVFGDKDFADKDLDKLKYEDAEKPPAKKPAVFVLEKEQLVTEIIFNTFNDGKGAEPGIISVMDNKGQVVAAFQANGGNLGEVANGIWKTDPNLVLPKGTYSLAVSSPEVVSYNKFGYPQFYVKTTDVPPMRYDFTGTYIIDLETKKVSTLMGPVTDGGSSFSLKDFELAVLDKNGEIELAGKYNGIPFSQGCKIIEEKENGIKAVFRFDADLSNLPYKAKIGAECTVILKKEKEGPPVIYIEGTGFYQRAESKTKGADYNTYSVKANGEMKNDSLPPFVTAALAGIGGIGNIPGPGSPSKAAAGLLFPPLVGLVVNVIQDMIKKKEEEESKKPKKYSKAWYRSQYPNVSEETLAWIILADAMANTDEPDAEDKESESDEKPEANQENSDSENDGDYSENEGGDAEESEESEQESDEGEESADASGEKADEISEGMDKQENNQNNGAEDISKTENADEQKDTGKDADNAGKEQEGDKQQEPETLTIQTDHTGRTATYVKDPSTGEWINPETGGVLDLERYYRDVLPQFEKTKAFIEGEREKLEKGDTQFDKELKKFFQDKKEADEKAAYIENLKKKYGVSDEGKLKEIIEDKKRIEENSAATWNMIGNVSKAGEVISTGVGVIADTAIDGLSAVTGPAGAQIKGVYKITKGIAGNVADKGLSTKSVIGGAIKGGADALTDKVDSWYVKAGISIAGEVAGGAVTEDNWSKGAKDGFVDGVSKVIVGTVTDKLAGEGFGKIIGTANAGKGMIRIAVNTGDKWTGRTVTEGVANKFINKKIMNQAIQSGVKIASGLTDELGIKPGILQPIKDKYQ